MRVSNRCLALLLAICPLTCAGAAELVPFAEGTTWIYEMIQERSESANLDLTEPNPKDRFTVTYRMAGTQKVEGKDLLKLEMYRDDALANTDLITVDDRGIICSARTDEKSALVKLTPPQTMLAIPLKTGMEWNFDGQIGETKVRQHYQVAGEEDVDVPAGKFHAWRIHCEQTSPSAASIDRWFVPGTGFIKVVTTINGPSGLLLQKTSLDLKEMPKVQVQSETKSAIDSGKLTVGLSKEPAGDFMTAFGSNAPAIYARWEGHDLRAQATIRAVLIAENVANVTTGYEMDEDSAVAPSSNSRGTLTLDRPEEGWAPGDYRVDFYVDDAPAGTVKLKITK
jgi:hypothetical protein